jgi:hypothetical protein
MTKSGLVGALALIGASVVACGNESRERDRSQPAPGSSARTAAPVVPGSHEDWCEEHGVPESVCTRCDPSLIPAFKATNDWCEEHGLPESQCRTCNPDLVIVRPPKPEGE